MKSILDDSLYYSFIHWAQEAQLLALEVKIVAWLPIRLWQFYSARLVVLLAARITY